MGRDSVRRVSAVVAVVGLVAFSWFVFDHQRSERAKRALPAQTATVPTTVGLRTELEQLGTFSAVVEASGASQGRFVLGLSEGGIDTYWSETEDTRETRDTGLAPPWHLRAKYEGGGWTLTLVAQELEIGVSRFDRMTLVITIEGQTFGISSGFCELRLLQVPYDIIELPWGGYSYQPQSALGRVSCVGLAEVRTGDLLSFDAFSRLPAVGEWFLP
jgi:hypothetical protein